MPSVTSDELIETISKILVGAGTSPDNARLVAELLAEANSTGHDSHGLIRIPQYLDAVEKEDIVPNAAVEIVQENPMTATVDGHWGFGQVTMTKAVDIGLDKAKKHGLAAVTVRNSNHIGRLGSYVDHIARQGMISFLFVNAVGIPAFRMAPWGRHRTASGHGSDRIRYSTLLGRTDRDGHDFHRRRRGKSARQTQSK